MATYYVTVNRPAVESATPEEAAQKALSDPLGPNDVIFVKEVPVDGSVHAVPGGAVLLGGIIPQPDEVYEGGPVLKRRN